MQIAEAAVKKSPSPLPRTRADSNVIEDADAPLAALERKLELWRSLRVTSEQDGWGDCEGNRLLACA